MQSNGETRRVVGYSNTFGVWLRDGLYGVSSEHKGFVKSDTVLLCSNPFRPGWIRHPDQPYFRRTFLVPLLDGQKEVNGPASFCAIVERPMSPSSKMPSLAYFSVNVPITPAAHAVAAVLAQHNKDVICATNGSSKRVDIGLSHPSVTGWPVIVDRPRSPTIMFLQVSDWFISQLMKNAGSVAHALATLAEKINRSRSLKAAVKRLPACTQEELPSNVARLLEHIVEAIEPVYHLIAIREEKRSVIISPMARRIIP